MPQRDLIHDAVREALEKDGWNITADPYTFNYKRIQVHADLEAERVVEAEQDGRRIIVEIKSFIGLSAVNDFENALGQYEFHNAARPENPIPLWIRMNGLPFQAFALTKCRPTFQFKKFFVVPKMLPTLSAFTTDGVVPEYACYENLQVQTGTDRPTRT